MGLYAARSWLDSFVARRGRVMGLGGEVGRRACLGLEREDVWWWRW